MTYGCLCSYVVAVGGLVSGLIEDWSDSDAFWTSEIFICLVTGVLLLPLCLAKHYGNLVGTATYSLIAITLVVGLILIYGPIEGSQYQSESLSWWSAKGGFEELGSIFFALSFAHATFHAIACMADKSPGTEWGLCGSG